jgi:ornithine cyclodeaminase
MVWDARTLSLRGIVASDVLNEHRTAAGIAAATRCLARPDASVLTLFGAGKLAWAAARYLCDVRPIRRIHIVSRTPQRVLALAERLASDPSLAHVRVDTEATAEQATRAADIVTTVTTSSEPVFEGAWLRPGTHVNLAGAFRPTAREMDDRAAAAATFWCDSLEACLARSGDIRIPLESGAISRAQLAGEIGAALDGRIPGRTSNAQVTVFKSLGTAAQDLLLASSLLERAAALGLGQTLSQD